MNKAYVWAVLYNVPWPLDPGFNAWYKMYRKMDIIIVCDNSAISKALARAVQAVAVQAVAISKNMNMNKNIRVGLARYGEVGPEMFHPLDFKTPEKGFPLLNTNSRLCFLKTRDVITPRRNSTL